MQIEVLGERYQLQDPIGRGGMATIYRGRDMHMDRTVAIKVLREVYSTDPKFVTRFQREAKAASSLQHPNIVQVYDYGQSDGNYFIVMELVEGTDLRRYLRSRGVLAIDRAIIIAHDVALGLGAAHRRRIVHRDVKPQNILVGRDGSIKLTDFGIASVYKDINDERLTTTGMTLGTVQYYAPEQAQGEIVSPAADVYALGIVMYEMLTGRTPFDGDTPVAVAMQHIQDAPLPPSQLNPNIPPALEEIILRCLEKVPEMRYRDGSTLARALETLGGDDSATQLASKLPVQSGYGLIAPAPNGQAPAPSNPFPPSIAASEPQQPVGAVPLSPSPSPSSNPSNLENGAATVLRTEPPPYASPHAVEAAAAATTAMEQTKIASGIGDSGSEVTRPFKRDSLGRAATVHGRGNSRMIGLVTALILAATVILLALSVYLASQIDLPPSLMGPHSQATATVQVAVPNLVGKTYQQAQKAAKSKGFSVTVSSGPSGGFVKGQWPPAGSKSTPDSANPIHLDMRALDVVPTDLIGRPLSAVETELNNDGINFVPQPDPSDTNDPTKGPDTVTSVDPSGGTHLDTNSTVTIYVANMTGLAPTQVVATPTPTAQPTQAPKPTAAPTPKPTATPTPQPTPTAQPTAQPTAKPQPTVTASPVTGTGSGSIVSSSTP
jgi:Serine/threonine protein kinase